MYFHSYVYNILQSFWLSVKTEMQFEMTMSGCKSQ